MDKERFEAGLAMRRQVLGDDYVDAALTNADQFNLPFQEHLTEFCWGACWADDSLSPRERSILNLGMIAALNRMHEWEVHFRAAMGNGLTSDELRAILIQISAYCGMPAAVECFRIARKVLAEKNA